MGVSFSSSSVDVVLDLASGRHSVLLPLSRHRRPRSDHISYALVMLSPPGAVDRPAVRCQSRFTLPDGVLIKRGDWFVTGSASNSPPVCREYTLRSRGGNYLRTLPPRTYFGPVHAIESARNFTSVLVPTSLVGSSHELAWINVERDGRCFAHLVDTEPWIAAGWVNWYVPLTDNILTSD